MDIVKRNGTKEPLKLEKISSRIKKLTYGLDERVDPDVVSAKVASGLYDGVSSTELDKLSAETAASMVTTHPDYGKLAARIAITSLYKDVEKDFSSVAKKLYEYINPKTNQPAGMISDEVYSVISNYSEELDGMIVHDRDFNFDFFGFKTLEKSYLLKIDGKPAETPQHLYMRVAVGIWRDNLEMVQKTYDMLSQGLFTHATPTLFNAGTNRPQLSSCFLLDIDDDSIPGIYKTLSDCALISQSAGGIGVNIHKIRAKGSYIKGTNGYSNGIIPMLRVFNETARYVDQGGGKRKGSIAVYLEPWHGDIFDFLDLRKNHGKEELRARDLFLALWIPDLFMQRVEADGNWSLFSPEQVPCLIDAYDSPDNKAFTELYEKYEAEGKALRTIKARELWEKVLDSQVETGTPYMLYKDACNYKSNQKNLGTIKSSNLCLAGDSVITALIGDLVFDIPLEKLVSLFQNGEAISVSSFNTQTGEQEFKPVLNAALMNPKSKVLKITDTESGKSIVCTSDHKVYTKNRGYVVAGSLLSTDILSFNKKASQND